MGVVDSRQKKRQVNVRWNRELLELTVDQKRTYDCWRQGGGGAEAAREEYRIISRMKRKLVRKLEREEEIKRSKDIEELRSSNPKEFWRKLHENNRKHLPKQVINIHEYW